MKSKNFTKPIKAVSTNKEFTPHDEPYRGNRDANVQVKEPGVQQAMADVYEAILPRLQNERKWEESTCRSSDRIAWNVIMPVFADIEFASIDDQELIMRWHIINEADYSEGVKSRCYFLLRAIFLMAYELGYTKLTMWGMPKMWDDQDDQYGCRDMPDEEMMAEELIMRGIKIQATMPMKTVLALTREVVRDCKDHGELMGLLIMILAGARTSEALAVTYKDVVEYKPGKWAIAIHDTQIQGKRESQEGGKTPNAPRWLPVPSFFAGLVRDRKAHATRVYPRQKIADLEIACVGHDYTRGVTQGELNLWAKTLYQKVGGDEVLWAESMAVLLTDKDEAIDNEGSATAYLLRHQFCTAMVACGLTPSEIQSVMGHKVEANDLRKYDFANSDALEELAQKMEQRGLVQLLNESQRTEPIICDGNTLEIKSQGDVTLYFPKAGEYQIDVCAREAGRPLTDEVHGGRVIDVIETTRLPEGPRGSVLMKTSIYDRAKLAWGDILAADLSVSKPMPAITDRFWIQSLLTPPAVKPAVLAVSTEETAKEPAFKPVRYARLACDAWAVTDQDEIVALTCGPLPVNRRLAVRGEVVTPESCSRIQKIIMHDPARPAYIICDNGMAYYVPSGKTPEQLDGTLLRSATWIQVPESVDELSLVCLSRHGGAVRLGPEVLRRITETGVQLVTLDVGDNIVSACLCTSGDDLLLVSARGRALRLTGTNLEARKSMGCQLIRGLGLQDGDWAVHCTPYEQSETYLVGVDAGKVAHIDAGDDLMAHGRGTTGRAYVGGIRKDYVTAMTCYQSYVVLLSDRGRAVCVDANNFVPHKMGSVGVRALKLKGDEQLVAILPAVALLDRH